MEPNFDVDETFGLKDERALWRRAVVVTLGTIGFVLAVIFLVHSVRAYGAPIEQAGDDRVTVTLTDEPCAVAAVFNLPKRATWAETGRVFEGCYDKAGGLVILYFEGDRTVVVVPSRVFQQVTGT